MSNDEITFIRFDYRKDLLDDLRTWAIGSAFVVTGFAIFGFVLEILETTGLSSTSGPNNGEPGVLTYNGVAAGLMVCLAALFYVLARWIIRRYRGLKFSDREGTIYELIQISSELERQALRQRNLFAENLERDARVRLAPVGLFILSRDENGDLYKQFSRGMNEDVVPEREIYFRREVEWSRGTG